MMNSKEMRDLSSINAGNSEARGLGQPTGCITYTIYFLGYVSSSPGLWVLAAMMKTWRHIKWSSCLVLDCFVSVTTSTAIHGQIDQLFPALETRKGQARGAGRLLRTSSVEVEELSEAPVH